MSTYKVGLEFNAKTGAIDEAANKLNGVQNTIKALTGRDPFSALANGAQGLANASKAAKQQLSDQTSAIRAQQVAQRDLLKELDNLKKKQIELNAAAKGRANGGAFTKDEIQGLKNVSAQIDQTNARYEAGKRTLVAYRHEVEKLNKAQASGGGGGGLMGGLTSMAGNFAPAISGMAAMAGTAALAAGAVTAAGAAVVATIKPMVDFTNVVDRNRQQLTMFTHDAVKTEGIIKSLQRTADATSLGLPGLLEATKTMAAYGIEAENAGAATKMLGDLALGDNEKLQRFSVNLAQISSLGKAYTVDLKQFGMAGIPIFAALSKTTGKSTAAIMKMAEEGKITYPIVIKALQSLTAEGADFYNGAEKGGTDLDRAMNQLTGAWEKLSILIGNAVTPAVVGTFKMLADILNAITTVVKDAVNEMQWFALGVKDAFSKNAVLKQFASGLSIIAGWFQKLGNSKFLAFMMNPGAMMLPPGLKELIGLALQWQDGKDKNPKNKVDNAAANELERRKLAESALAQARKAAIDEHAKLETDLAKEKAALNKQLGRSLAEAERGYAVQLADFRISQIEKIAALERTMADERRTAEFKLAQDRQKLLDTEKDDEYGDRIRAARGRGEDTGGLELAQKLAAISSKSAADRKQAAFDQRTKEIELQRRLSDFKIETQKQIGEMAKAYARQVEGIYRTAAQTLNDKLIAAALESKKILESVKIPTADDGANGGGGGGNTASVATGAFASLSKIIGKRESYGGDYTAFNRGGSNNGHTAHGSGKDPNLVNMTIAEIQRRQLAPGIPKNQELHAVGKYQIIGDTLKALLKGNYGNTGVKASDKFTPENQEKLGGALASNRIVKNNPQATMRGLRQEWIGLQNEPDSKLLPAVKALMYGGIKDEVKKLMPQKPQTATPGAFEVKQPKTALEIITAGDPNLAKAAKPAQAKPAQAKLPNQITAPGEAALQQQLRGGAANGIRPSTLGGGGIPLTSPGLEKSTNALMQTNKDSGKVAELQKEKEVREQIKALIDGTSQSYQTELLNAKQKNELDAATLELMKTGVTPELAAQLALNQQQAQIATARLEKAKSGIEAEKNLTGEAKKEQELKLKLINEQIAAIPALLSGLDAEAQKTKAIADAREGFNNGQKIKNHMDGMKKELNDTQGQVIKLSSAIESELGSAMSGALTGLIDGTQKADQAFAQMFKNIGKAFIDMATQMLAKAVVLQAMGILFPGSGTPGVAPKLGPGFAAGGTPPVGVPSLVGEQGPELFIPGQTGLVVPNDIFTATRKAIGEGGGGDAGGAAFAENQQAIAQSNTINRERVIQQDFNSAMEAGYEPINVKVDAFDPSAAGLVTVGQLEQSNKMAVAQAQAKIMQKFKNNPGVRAGAGLR